MKGKTTIAVLMAATMAVGGAVFAADNVKISDKATIVIGYPADKDGKTQPHGKPATKDTASIDAAAGASVLLDSHPVVKDEKHKTINEYEDLDWPYGVNEQGKRVGPSNLMAHLQPKDEAFDVARVAIHYTRTDYGLNAISSGNGTAIGADTVAFGKGAVAMGFNARTGVAFYDNHATKAERDAKAVVHDNMRIVGSENALALGSNSDAFGENSSAIGAGASTGWVEETKRAGAYDKNTPDAYKHVDEDTIATNKPIKYNGPLRGEDTEKAVTDQKTYRVHESKNALAIGAKSKVRADNSVALGVNSVALEDNTVSVGTATLQRRITNAADGRWEAGSHDVATTGQVYKEMGKTGAMAAALAGLHPMVQSQTGWEVSAAMGTYNGKSAVALGGFYHTNPNMMISLGAASAFSGHVTGNLGITYRVGAGNTGTEQDMSAVAQQIRALTQRVNALAAENYQLRQAVQQLSRR